MIQINQINKGGIMIIKSNYFVSICNIISKQIGRKVFPFMSAKEVMDIKNNVYKFPIHKYYNQKRRVK